MAVSKRFYTQCDDGEVYEYVLDNGELRAVILNYGAAVTRLIVRGREGKETDVVLSCGSPEEMLKNDCYFGAVIGRYANRIKNAHYELNGRIYSVTANEGAHCLHGGEKGFSRRPWKETELLDGSEPSLKLTLVSPDGDEGFCGRLTVSVTYTITKENGLRIEYNYICDDDTICSLTSHGYFNLAGHDSGSIEKQILQLESDFYAPCTREEIPNGEIRSVGNTPFDFRAPAVIGAGLRSEAEQIRICRGYNHCFMINGRGFRAAAHAKCLETGICMDVYTDMPAMQLYTANVLEVGAYKDGARYAPYQAFCIETQYAPNSTEFAHFPGAFTEKNKRYSSVTEYRFGVI